MFMVKSTGLVPVRSLQRGGRSGIFGITPENARQGLQEKTLELVEIPSDIEVVEVAGLPQPKPEPKQEDGQLIPIPDDWKEHEGLWRFNFAKKLTGSAPVLTEEDKAAGLKASDIADALIEAEIQRRAAAEEPAD